MLMTPITPKVMARPIAASSRTEPSESPYQVFCNADQNAKLVSIDAVVEAHRRKSGGRAAADRFAGWGVDRAVRGRLANESALAVGAKKQAPLLQGADDRCGERVAARGNRVDTLDRVVEAVGREAEKPILVGSGAGRRHHGGEHAKRTHERHEAIAEGTHPDRPGISERGGPISAIRWAASLPAPNASGFYPDNATTRHRTSWSPYCSCRI